MNSNSNSFGIALVAILMSIVAMYVAVAKTAPAPDANLGATRPSTSFEATILARGGLRLGSSANATTLQNVQMTTCNATFLGGASLAATSSGQFTCAVTGVTAGDKVFVMLPAGAGANPQGSASPYGGFVAGSGYATTTGVVGFNITNLTGAATSSFAQATSGVQVLVIR